MIDHDGSTALRLSNLGVWLSRVEINTQFGGQSKTRDKEVWSSTLLVNSHVAVKKEIETSFSQSENKIIPNTKGIKKTHEKTRKENGTKMKHPQMVVSKQTALWLFWDD